MAIGQITIAEYQTVIVSSKMSMNPCQGLLVWMNKILITLLCPVKQLSPNIETLWLSISDNLFWVSCEYCLLFLFNAHRQPGEPVVENGFIPYLGCALKFGANPLQFLRSRQNKYGHIFTCKIAGQYIHFLCDPFSYHSVIRQGRHLDWRKFHFATSVKVNLYDFIFYYSYYILS